MPTATYEKALDGRYHCTFAGCADVSYDRPQALGIHLYRKHGVEGKSRAKTTTKRRPAKAKDSGAGKSLVHVPRTRQEPLTPEAICITVLRTLSPHGVDLDALPQYSRWLKATEELMAAL